MKFPAFSPINLKNDTEVLGVIQLPLTQIIPDENQPRKNFDEQALNELAVSITLHGVIQPIIVRKLTEDKYQIVAGERRWRAAHLAKCQAIPAIVQQYNCQENRAISLIENIQREELNPIELAEAFHQLNTDYNLSHEAIAAMVGKNRATVTNLLRLLNLSQDIRQLLVEGQLEMGHARALLTLPCEQQVELANRIIEKKLTVREAEKLVQFRKSTRKKQKYPHNIELDDLTKKLSNSLSLKVSANINERGEGKIMIHFTSLAEVDWMIDQLPERT